MRTEPPKGRDDPWYAGATLLDSFGLLLPPSTPSDVHRLAKLALERPPLAFRAIMMLRDAVMMRLGVKTSSEIAAAPDGRERIDFFPVLRRTADEIELGEDDRHVDFRTWLTMRTVGDDRIFLSTTMAIAHFRLGRCYLAIIRPFHVVIVMASLRRVLRRLGSDSAGIAPSTPSPVSRRGRR